MYKQIGWAFKEKQKIVCYSSTNADIQSEKNEIQNMH